MDEVGAEVDEVRVEVVDEFPLDDEVVEAEVLNWLDELEAEGVADGEEVGPGRAGVVEGCLAQFDCSSSLLRTSA